MFDAKQIAGFGAFLSPQIVPHLDMTGQRLVAPVADDGPLVVQMASFFPSFQEVSDSLTLYTKTFFANVRVMVKKIKRFGSFFSFLGSQTVSVAVRHRIKLSSRVEDVAVDHHVVHPACLQLEGDAGAVHVVREVSLRKPASVVFRVARLILHLHSHVHV